MDGDYMHVDGTVDGGRKDDESEYRGKIDDQMANNRMSDGENFGAFVL